MLISGLVLLIRNIVNHNFSYNFFSTEEGFGSILYCWDFRNCFVFKPKSFSFNFPVLIHQPEFSLQMLSKAWASYIFVPGMTIGGLWYLWCVQSLISRMIRIHKLSDSIFDKNLDNFNQNEQLMNSISNTLKKVESPQNRDKISNN